MPEDPKIPELPPEDEPERASNRNPTLGGAKSRLRPGLPAAGDTHLPDAEIAPVIAGARSAIESLKGRINDFFEKYWPYFGVDKTKGLWNLESISKEIDKLDHGSSDQIMGRVKSVSDRMHELYMAARSEIAQKLRDKMWGQKFPKYTEEQLRKALSTARRSDRVAHDAELRSKMERLENNLGEFKDEIKRKLLVDPEFVALSNEYEVVAASLHTAQTQAGKIARSAGSGEKADAVVGRRYQKMRPVKLKGEDEPIGWVPMGEPETRPKPAIEPISNTWAKAGGSAPSNQITQIDRDIATILAKTKGDVGLLNRNDRDMLSQLKAKRASLSGGVGPIVRKKHESFERLFGFLFKRDVP